MDRDNIYRGNEDESKSLYKKNLLIAILGTVTLLCITLPVTFGDSKSYVSAMEVLSLVFELCTFISVMIAYRISHKAVFMYLEISLGVISLINIVFLIAIIRSKDVFDGIPNICYLFKYVMNYILYTSSIVFSIFLKDSSTDKVLRRVHTAYGIIPLMIVITIEANEKYFDSYSNVKLNTVAFFNEVVFLILLFICLIIIYRNFSKLKSAGVFGKLIAADIMFMISHAISLGHMSFSDSINRYSYVFALIGTIIICDVIIKMTLKKQLIYFYKLMIDQSNEITDLKDMSEKVFQSTSDGIIIRDNNDVVFANTSMLEMTKAYSKEDFNGFDVVKLISNKYIKEFKQYNKLLCEGRDVDNVREELVCFDGNKVMVEVNCKKIRFNGKAMILSVVRNISKQIKAEQNEKELIKAKNKDKLRGEFFANISHELRTPINVIYSSLQVMQMHIKKDNINNDKIECYMNVIKQNCYRLLRIISNLIDITKIEAGFLKPNISTCEIISLVENISMSIVTYLHEKNMELVFDTDVEEKYIECDPDMMERVMLNLFSNAVKFRKNNGHVWINIHDTKDGNITIEVKDDGIGIPEEKQHLIFKRFTQVDNSLIRRSKGSGIGLSLVKSIIEMNSGSISFKSKESVGTKFIIKLPSNNNEIMQEYSGVKGISDSSIDNTKEKVNIEFADICN